MKKAKKEKAEPRFTIDLQVGSKNYVGKGETLFECLKGIKVTAFDHWGVFKVTEVKDDEKKTSDIPLRINSLKLQLLFRRDADMQIFAKRLEVLR